jgi:hypothetical protein
MAKLSNPSWKNARAIATGFLAVVLLSLITDQILHVLKVYPPWNQPMRDPRLNLLALAYRIAFTVFGGYLAARLSARSPMRQVWILGIVGTAFGTLGVVSTWNLDLGPHWYPIALALTAIPCTWLGGRLVWGNDRDAG